MYKLLKLPEKHTNKFWALLRAIEIITCMFIIAGVIHHW